jgi:hypothetical protein
LGAVASAKAAEDDANRRRRKLILVKAPHLSFRLRENLDSTFIAFRMFILCEGTIERATIAKLKENFWSNRCRTT